MPQDPVSDQRSDPLGTAVGDADERISALEKTGQFWPGMVSWTAAAAAPPGWLIADGSDFDGDRYAALAAALGSTTLPDLRNRIPVGAGDTYALLDTGGASDVTLTGAQSGQPAVTTAGPSVANTGAGTAHTHTNSVGTQSANHTHNSGISTAGGANVNNFVPPNNATGSGFNWTSSTESANHIHTVTINNESAHTHSLSSHTHTIAAANAASAHSVMNPYVALTPLIHI